MKICVIGDIIHDLYYYGTTERLNPEGPIPLVRKTGSTTSLGGAGLVWENLVSLGLDADLLDYDDKLKSTKIRIISDGHTICRLDDENPFLYQDTAKQVLQKAQNLDFSQYEYCILSDYHKGALDFAPEIIKMANAVGCKVIVDPKRNCNHYKGAWLIKPNDIESRSLGFESWDGNTLLTTHTTNVLIIDDKSYFSDVEEGEVVDVTGAGDCFLSAFVYGLVKGYDYQRCVDVATKGATKSVQYAGTYVLKVEDVESKIIFTNGCFDILHRGHIKYLERSKKLGDKLIVGLNSDASIKRLKGESRPINNEEDRKTLLESLKYVDEVIIFDEDTPYELIKKIKPDIITKGGDYTPETIVGNDLAEVIVLPYVKDYSTTNIVSKLND